eukprot:5874298-Prymnesium_polylepis.1
MSFDVSAWNCGYHTHTRAWEGAPKQRHARGRRITPTARGWRAGGGPFEAAAGWSGGNSRRRRCPPGRGSRCQPW